MRTEMRQMPCSTAGEAHTPWTSERHLAAPLVNEDAEQCPEDPKEDELSSTRVHTRRDTWRAELTSPSTNSNKREHLRIDPAPRAPKRHTTAI